jgi:hypothetical protein
MPHQQELNRIDAAIRQRNQTELLWAQEYCRTRLRAAVPNDMRNWKKVQRDVGRVLRELGLTEGHISAHEWSSYHRETLRESDVAAAFTAWRFFRRARSKTGPTTMTRRFVPNAESIPSLAQSLDTLSSASFFRRCTIIGSRN